jgi:hypothetical protein
MDEQVAGPVLSVNIVKSPNSKKANILREWELWSHITEAMSTPISQQGTVSPRDKSCIY